MATARLLFEGLENRLLLQGGGALVQQFQATLPVPVPVGTSDTFADLPKFDSKGGARTLQSVSVELSVTTTQGRFEYDSSSASEGTIELLQTGANVRVFLPAVLAVDFDLSVLASKMQVAVAASDEAVGDPPDFLGLDSAFVDVTGLSQQSSPISLMSPPDNLSAFIASVGSTNLLFSYESFSLESLQIAPAGATQGLAVVFDFTVTVTYTYSAEANLDISKGVVATDNPDGVFSPSRAGPVLFTPPGGAGPRFTGSITTALLSADPINSNLSNVVGGDLVTFAVVLENFTFEDLYDLRLTDTIPDGFSIPVGGPNLFVSLGTGVAVGYAPVNPAYVGDPALALFTGFDAQGIELVNGANGAMGPVDGPAGENVVILTYDLVMDEDIPDGTYANTATWYNVAFSEEGENLEEAGLRDSARVTVATGGITYVTDVFSRDLAAPHRVARIAPTIPHYPYYSGTAEPGSVLSISLYDSRGGLLASQDAVVDAGGNWLAGFFDTPLTDQPVSIVIRQDFAAVDPYADAGYNLRTYFAPALQGGAFVSEELTVRDVLGKRSANAVLAMYQASLNPIGLGWRAFPYDFLCMPASPAGY